jgi:hypothetical protein
MVQAWARTTHLQTSEHRMKKALLAAIGALALVVATAGCGSDKAEAKKPDLSKDEKTVVANISKSFASQTSGSLSKKESDCFAENFVDKVGLKKLKEAKLITADGQLNEQGAAFDAEISGEFADAFLGCVDYQARQAEEIAKADTTVDKDKLQSCLEKEMPSDFVKKLIVASQTQSKDSATLVEQSTKKLTDCKTAATKK